MRVAATLALALLVACGGGGSPAPEPPPEPTLPPEWVSLAPGFTVESVATGLAKPVRMALAPDGRLFFNELDTGDVRVIDAGGTLLPAPFAHVDVLTGGHDGLLGLALAPDFAASGHLFVVATSPAGGGHGDRLRVVRFTDVGGVGTAPTTIVDDLAVAPTNNGGDLVFGPDGTFYLSRGDVMVDASAQAPGSLTGRVLRYTASGGIPADNPTPGSPEWCRGLRNTFALAVHPVTGGLFGADNGPASDDELNFLQAGKDFGWPAPPAGNAGFRIQHWPDVIVPTALAWHTGTRWGAEYADSLFLAAYDDQTIRRLRLSGAAFTDLDAEEVFAQLAPGGIDHKPLDLLVEPDGSLLVSTFTSIWRIRRLP